MGLVSFRIARFLPCLLLPLALLESLTLQSNSLDTRVSLRIWGIAWCALHIHCTLGGCVIFLGEDRHEAATLYKSILSNYNSYYIIGITFCRLYVKLHECSDEKTIHPIHSPYTFPLFPNFSFNQYVSSLAANILIRYLGA
jgi:hypothetical protein